MMNNSIRFVLLISYLILNKECMRVLNKRQLYTITLIEPFKEQKNNIYKLTFILELLNGRIVVSCYYGGISL